MPDNYELFKQSVTAADAPVYQGNGVVNFMIPWFMLGAANLPLPTELPPYWSLRFGVAAYWSRDLILRTTILHESFWSGAVFKTATKAASISFKLTGKRIDRLQDMLLDWGGDGYVPSMQRGMLDYLTTDNGEFWEIVRVSNAAGSRIIGLVHLDSLRVIRTGDQQTPFLFLDLHGRYHELRDYQIISLVDMPDPASASLGIGHCAAERAYGKIYTVSVMEQYFKEKVTGTGANNLDIIRGLTDAQLQGVTTDGKAEATRRGQVYYQGNIILGLLGQQDLQHTRIPLRELPDGYSHDTELQIAQLAYANAIGIDPQSINPQLVGRGALGIGAQSTILAEKEAGYGPAARAKHLTHLLNRDILPDSVTFAFSERDLRDEMQEAQISGVRATTRSTQITAGEITAQEARQLAADSKDIPPEFLTVDQTDTVSVSDEEKPTEEADMQGAVEPQAQTPISTIAADVAASQKELDALIALKESIDKAREMMRDQSNTQPQWLSEYMIGAKSEQEQTTRSLLDTLKAALKREPTPIMINNPPIKIETKETQPIINVNVPQQAAPVVNVTNEVDPTPITNQINVKPTPITNQVNLATDEERVTTIERDKNNDMTRTRTQITRK